MLYEVAAVLEPTPKEDEDGKLEELILGPITVIAANPEAAGMTVILNNATEFSKKDPSRVKMLIRPFV